MLNLIGKEAIFMVVAVIILTTANVSVATETFTCTDGNFKDPIGINKGDYDGQCIVYTRYETGIACSGDAGDCYQQAQDAGYTVGNEPRESAIIVFGKIPNTALSHGHVGIITRIDGNNVTIRDSNWTKPYTIDEHTEDITNPNHPILGYIYCDGEQEPDSRDVTVASQGNYAWETGISSDCENGKSHFIITDNGYGFPISKYEACQGVNNVCNSAPSQQ